MFNRIKQWVKISKIIAPFQAIILVVIGIFLAVWNIISGFIKFKQTIDLANSQPSGRKETMGQVDEHGYKQVEVAGASKEDIKDTPSGVETSSITSVSATGTLIPVADQENDQESKTEDVLDDINKRIEDAEKE